MFGYLRIFSVLSLLAVILIAVVAGISFRDSRLNELVLMVERNNASLSQGYIDNVWKKYRDIIVPISTSDPSQLATDPQVKLFAQETVQYFQRMPLLRVNIYNSAGLLLMSVSPNDVYNKIRIDPAAPASPNSTYITRNLAQPATVSTLLHNVPAQVGPTLTVLQTMVPIRLQVLGNNDGALEMIYDMTSMWNQVVEFQVYGTGGFIALFFVLLTILFISSKRAENIIARQLEGNMELAASAAAAQAESREKSQFLANISHELRTPLNAIIGFSELIKNEVMPGIKDKKYHDYISDIHSSGVHLLSLINDILDYSKAEAGKLDLEVSETNVTKLIQNSMRLMAPRAEIAKVKLVEALPKDAIIMIIDSKKLRQILLNLLSNAVKFTQPEGEIRITAWRNVGEDTFSFEVKDSGIGIAPKDISRAMMPFGQVDSTLSRKYEGTGLGLPLTKKFVELMGGKFAIESKVNVGTTITFTLPKEIKPQEGVVIKKQEEI
jgi:two-component system cell cycle sensor histidine kinase PleC